VFDLAPWDWERKVKVARSLGGFAWHRTAIPGLWGEHIHIGIRNHPTLSPAAAQQQRYFDQKPRRDGLAGEAVDPDQYPPRPTPTFHYPPKDPPMPTFQAVSLNDDWGNYASDVPTVVGEVRPLAMGVQEGWRRVYAKTIRHADPKHPRRWRVKQRRESKATAGVAVIWDRRRLTTVGHARNPRRRGSGWQAIGKGADTRVRGVVWRDLEFKPGVERGGLPRRFRLASVHRPPMRNRSSWGAFDARLGLWLKRSPLPVLLLMDSNEHGGPQPLMTGAGTLLSWHAVDNSIDGAVTSLPVRDVRELPKRTSDHAAVVITLG
jgi:hypothetical protein